MRNLAPLKYWVIVWGVTFLCIATAVANEDNVIAERATLANVVDELTYLQAMLKETQNSVGTSRFDYNQIQADINAIKRKIADYLDAANRKPKSSNADSVGGLK